LRRSRLGDAGIDWETWQPKEKKVKEIVACNDAGMPANSKMT
jgi:hypothetical protein